MYCGDIGHGLSLNLLICALVSGSNRNLTASPLPVSTLPQLSASASTPLLLGTPVLPSLDDFQLRLRDIWQAKWLTNHGRQEQTLEARLKQYLGARDLKLFCNGTMALLLGLKALGLRGEVITTPFTFPATAHAIEWAGLTPVFADIDPLTLTLDPAAVERAITPQTSAVLGVHVFGMPCHLSALRAISQRHGLKLVYDAAHAFGTEVEGVPIAQFGDCSMFSFHATKLFHTAEGGALAFADPDLRRRLHLLHNFGISGEDQVEGSGINGKMSEIHAALGHCVLDDYESTRQRRALVFQRLTKALEDLPGLRVLTMPAGVKPSYQYFGLVFEAPDARERAWEALRQDHIHARRYFYPLCSSISTYRELPSAIASNLPVAAGIVERMLCLPCHDQVTETDVGRMAEIIRSIL